MTETPEEEVIFKFQRTMNAQNEAALNVKTGQRKNKRCQENKNK